MPEVHVRVHIEAPVERVFDVVSDHETFLRSEGGVSATVLREGERERNGTGCLREVRVGRRVRYVEEITAWQRPSSFEYMIRETSLPLRHAGSRLTFAPEGGNRCGVDLSLRDHGAHHRAPVGHPCQAHLRRVLQGPTARGEGSARRSNNHSPGCPLSRWRLSFAMTFSAFGSTSAGDDSG